MVQNRYPSTRLGSTLDLRLSAWGLCRVRWPARGEEEAGGNQLVLELKAVEAMEPIHVAQMLTYLRLRGKRVGLLINFNVAVLREGIRRFVL